MADLTDFEEDAVEMMSQNDGNPAAVIRATENEGVEMLLHTGDIAPGPNPQYDLIAAYALQISNRHDVTVGEVFEKIDDRLAAWSEDGEISVGEEDR